MNRKILISQILYILSTIKANLGQIVYMMQHIERGI